MSSSDSHKRKRQQTIEESFKRRRAVVHCAESKDIWPTLSEQHVTNLEEDLNLNQQALKRQLLLQAVEKRMRESPYNSPSTSDAVGSLEFSTESNEDGITEQSMDPPDPSPHQDDSQSLYSQSPQEYREARSKGVDLASLTRIPLCRGSLDEAMTQPDHTLLIRPHIIPDVPPRPYPSHYKDRWDKDHVRMPCSKDNLYPVSDGEAKIKSRWELIETTLLQPMNNSQDIQKAILTYNAHYSKKWNFEALHNFFDEACTPEERSEFFVSTLPAMARLALQLPTVCTHPIPLLKRQMAHSVTMSQKQAACLLANAFFCTFPRRSSQKHSEYSNFPDINFTRLFQGVKGGLSTIKKLEKIKAIVHYFRCVTKNTPTGTLTYKRQVLQPKDFPRWESCKSKLSNLHVTPDGNIEDDGTGFLQVDFANKFVGGGVLGMGCVQEEIRFLVCPEMILSRLFTEKLDSNECLFMMGVERFSDYTGYAHTFRWAGGYKDMTARDTWGRKCTEVVAIDAHVFRNYAEQFRACLLKRELDKAFCGFYWPASHPLSAIATGNWGCGAFGGDSRVKGLIQMMSSAAASRDLVYFTFGDSDLADDLYKMHSFLKSQDLTIGDIWELIKRYEHEICSQSSISIQLYPFIYRIYEAYDSDTDTQAQDTDKFWDDPTASSKLS